MSLADDLAREEPERGASESEVHSPDGTSSYVRFSRKPWGYEDYREFIRSTGQDPDEVTFSWGWTSNASGNGFWNKLNNVRPRVNADTLNFDGLRETVRGYRPTKRKPVPGEPEGFIVGLSDWQLGKSYGTGNGTAGTVERLEQSLDGTVRQIERLRSEGRNLRTLHLANLGDHIENVAGSYASQTYEVDLNLRDQIELAIELNMLWVKTLAPMFEQVIYTANPCNHAQLTRGQGRANVTDDADNATGLIAAMVGKITRLTKHLDHVDVRVPRGEMITPVTVEGVNIATAHGHKVTGNEEAWLAKQSQRLTHEHRFIPDLWLVAHKHSLNVTDFGPYSRIQTPAIDPGSKWYTDSNGNYSKAGTATFTVQRDRAWIWDDLKVF